MYFLWIFEKNPASFLNLAHLLLASIVILPGIYLEMCYELVGEKIPKLMRWGNILCGMFLIEKAFSTEMIRALSVTASGMYWPVAGPLFKYYLAIFFINFLIGLRIFFKKMKGDVSAKYLFIATLIGIIGGSTNFFQWYGIEITPYGNALVAMYVGIVFYAITKHNALNIRLILSKSAAGLISLGIISLLGAGVYIFLEHMKFYVSLEVFVFLLCSGVALFPFIFWMIYTPIEKRFLEGYYNIQKIIGDLSSDLIVSNNQVEILKLISKKLKEELETAESYFIYSHLEETTYKIYHHESESAVFSIENIQELEHVFFNKIEPIELKDLPKAAQKLAGPIPMSAMSLVVPIHSFEKLHGVMVLGQKLNKKRYNESDRAMIQATMNQLMVVFDRILYHQKMITLNNELNEKVAKQVKEIEEKRRLEKDLEVASQIQQQVLPSRVPKLYGHAIHAAFHPARMVSGDYYTFLMFSDHEIGIVIADIIGKGVTAAFQMMALNTIVHEVIQSTHTPKEACLRLNKAILENPIIKSYVPLIYAKLNTQTNTFTYCNAGHEEGLYKTGDDIKALTAGGSPLGADEIGVFDEEVLHLKDNDKIALFTDGLLDNRNKAGEGFGVDKMTHLMQRSQGRLGELIETEWCAFGDPNKPQKDDMTLIVIEHERVEIIEGSV